MKTETLHAAAQYFEAAQCPNGLLAGMFRRLAAESAKIPHADCSCDEGKHWNNADPESGQWVECLDCDWRER